MLGPLSFRDESFNSSSFLEFKKLTKDLWELRDEAISNAFILQDILSLLQLVDEVLQESTWFQFLKGFGPCQDSETSAFG